MIAAFARAALDPRQWHSALSLMSDTIGGVCCALECADTSTGAAAVAVTLRFDEQLIDDYEKRIFHINPRVRRARPMAVGRIVDDRDLLFADDPYVPEFLDWLGRMPFRHLQGAKLFDDGRHEIYFSTNFADRRGPPGAVQGEVHRVVIPHLVNQIAASRIISGGQLTNRLVTMSAFHGDRPFALLDRAGRLIECSQGFEAILRSSGLLTVSNRILAAVHPRHRVPLATLLQTTLGPRRFLDAPRPIRLSSGDRAGGIVLRAMPLPPNDDIFDVFRPAALVTVADLGEPHRIRRHDLVAIFDLTAREAEVAALIGEGWVTERIASHLSIGEHTVRQHLKSVFAKTGVSRQAALVALVARLA